MSKHRAHPVIVAMGKKIRQRRLELGYSQYDLEYLSGVSRPHIRSVEIGQTGISIEKMVAICKVLEVKSDWLIGMEG